MKHLKHLLMTVLMFGRILGLLFEEKWQSLVGSLPALVEARDSFKTMVDAIHEKIARYRLMARGIAAQKRQVKLSLIEMSYAIISSARSWAMKQGDLELASKLIVTYPEIKNMTYKKLIPFVQECISLIGPHVTQLSGFNVTPQSYQAWQTKFQEMVTINTRPGQAVKNRKALGKVIFQDVKTAMTFLEEQITPLIGNFQNTPEFFLAFYDNKKIGLPLTHHTILNAHVITDIGPVYAATVRVDEFTDPDTGKTYPAVSSVTDPQGNSQITEFFPGFRTVTISGSNIQTKTFSAIVFEKGRSVAHEFMVTPAFTNIPAPQQNPQNQNA